MRIGKFLLVLYCVFFFSVAILQFRSATILFSLVIGGGILMAWFIGRRRRDGWVDPAPEGDEEQRNSDSPPVSLLAEPNFKKAAMWIAGVVLIIVLTTVGTNVTLAGLFRRWIVPSWEASGILFILVLGLFSDIGKVLLLIILRISRLRTDREQKNADDELPTN